jgi:eukaryotic-like serine/threonine-protein kinase
VDVTRAGTISGRPRFVPEIDRTGSEVGIFRVESRLGGGGMGTVYRATSGDGAVVALKFLAPALADNPDVVARFAREIDMLARLEHPAIVRVLAHGTQDGTPWFAMALVDGSDLRARIAAGPLTPAETAAVFGRLFAALAHAHARGVVHRDLKPANVMVGEFGEVLVLDWGIAAELRSADRGTQIADSLRSADSIAGTPDYMAPEQARGDTDVDHRADVFALGAMLAGIAAGSAPVVAIARKAQSPDPASRYQSVAALAADVNRYLAGRAVEAHREPLVDLLVRVGRRHRLPILLVLTYVVARVLLLYLFRA